MVVLALGRVGGQSAKVSGDRTGTVHVPLVAARLLLYDLLQDVGGQPEQVGLWGRLAAMGEDDLVLHVPRRLLGSGLSAGLRLPGGGGLLGGGA